MPAETPAVNGAHPADVRQNRLARRKSLSTDRLPPHDSEAEAAVIGCCLTDAKSITRCEERISSPETFYDLRHQTAYAGIVAMHEAGEKVDVITLGAHLASKLAEIGGHNFLNECQDKCHSTANLDYYLEIICDKHVVRRIIASATEIVGRAYEHSGSLDGLIDQFEKDVLHVRSNHQPREVIDGKRAADELTVDMERRLELGDKLSGLETGLIDLNRKLDGFQPQEQVVVGARPSMGKTALGIGFFLHIGVHQQIPSLFVSLEMTSEAIMRRCASWYCSLPLQDIKKGKVADRDIPKIVTFNGRYSRSPVHIVDGVSGMTCREICAVVRRMVLKFGIKFVVIDYLQKVRPDIKHEKRTYEVGDVSGKLKALAAETGVAMVTLAQLNRENVQQKGRPPRLSDLADSGQIERDADTVLLIHRDKDNSCLIVGKQRDGETGVVPVFFNGQFVRFENAHRTEPSDHYQDKD